MSSSTLQLIFATYLPETECRRESSLWKSRKLAGAGFHAHTRKPQSSKLRSSVHWPHVHDGAMARNVGNGKRFSISDGAYLWMRLHQENVSVPIQSCAIDLRLFLYMRETV